MNNKDMPAMPFTDTEYDGEGKMYTYENHPGITKLEHFAGLAMQGLVVRDRFSTDDTKMMAQWSVECAKALLAELDKVSDDE